ncbi:MAG: CpaF family protein [Lachnospiraceae bacterium]|nr:CpaF family protein [Lachnospiraceae bacterium]
MDLAEIKNLIRERVQEKLDFRRDFSDAEVSEIIDEVILNSNEMTLMSLPQRRQIHKEIFDAIRRLDVLQRFVDDPAVTEIMINGMDNIFIERNGKISEIEDRFSSMEKLRDVIQQIVSGCNRVVNEMTPIVDARLSNGSRVNIVLPPVALNGPIITIRRFPDKPINMDSLIDKGSISAEAAELLINMVKAKYNIFISGGTGSGKTTFLNALSGYISDDERVITIEDSAELQLQGIKNLVRLETRNSNMEGCSEISIRDLIKSSLRMRPDRIVVGEVRGAEAIDMLQCLNTGHDGSMSTGHANSAKDMLARLENMVLMGVELPLAAIKQQIASGLDIIVHLGRLRDKSRKVLEISEVVGYEDGEIIMHPLYKFEEEGESKDGVIQGKLAQKDSLFRKEKMYAAGLSV